MAFRTESDPVALLRHFTKEIMYGRPLNLTSVESTIDGETVPIFISRFNLVETSTQELQTLFSDGCDFRQPLEVTFYDEKAVDLGKLDDCTRSH